VNRAASWGDFMGRLEQAVLIERGMMRWGRSIDSEVTFFDRGSTVFWGRIDRA